MNNLVYKTSEISVFDNRFPSWESWCVNNLPSAWRCFHTSVSHVRFEFEHYQDLVAFEIIRD